MGVELESVPGSRTSNPRLSTYSLPNLLLGAAGQLVQSMPGLSFLISGFIGPESLMEVGHSFRRVLDREQRYHGHHVLIAVPAPAYY